MDNKYKWLITFLSVVVIILLFVCGTVGFMYLRDRDQKNKAPAQNTNTSSNNTNTDVDNTGSGSTDNDKTNVDDSDNKTPVSVTKTITCSKWGYYVDSGMKTPPMMYIVYDDSGDVTFKNINEECVDMEMHYKGATVFLTYSNGEAYDVAFAKGTEVLTLKTGKTPYGTTATLARQKYTETKKDVKGVTAYWMNYVSLNTKTNCNKYNELAGAVIGYPCYTGANPFVTPAGRFDLSIPKGTSTDDILEIVKYVDNVAKKSYFTPMK